MFSPLARGVGPCFGTESGDQAKNQQAKKPTPFLPNLVPEPGHRHGVTVTPRAKSVGSVRSSRTEKPDGELVLPKTYITRKGALVLFVADEEILALQERKHLYMRAAKNLIKQKEVDYLDSIGSIPRFAQSVLTLGDEDYERENTSITDSKNQIYLKFLHSFGDRAVDLRAQPGGHVSTYLRDLQSRASTAISGHALSSTTGDVTTTPSSEKDLQSRTLYDESDACAKGRTFTRLCSAPSPGDRFSSLERQRSHEVLSTERLTASLKSANHLGSRDSPKYRTIGDFKCYYDYEYRPNSPRSSTSSPGRSQVISPEVRSVTASPQPLPDQGEDDVQPLDSAREDADHVTSQDREVDQAGEDEVGESPEEEVLLQDEANERLSVSPSVLEEQDIILEQDLTEVVTEEKQDQEETDLSRPDDEAAIIAQGGSRPHSQQVEVQDDDEAQVGTAIDAGHDGSGNDVIADEEAPPGEPSMLFDKGDLSGEDWAGVQDYTDVNRIDHDDIIVEDVPVANDNEVHSLLASPVGSVLGVTPDQDKLHLAEDYVEEVLKYDKAEEERSRSSSVSVGDLEPQPEPLSSPQELRIEDVEATPDDVIEVTRPDVEDVDRTVDDDIQTADPEIESFDHQAIEHSGVDQSLDNQKKIIEDQSEKPASDEQGIHRVEEESVVPLEPEAGIEEAVTSPPEVEKKALPDDVINIIKSDENDKEDKAKKDKMITETKPHGKKKITSKSPQRDPKSDAGAEQSKKKEAKKEESVPKDKVKKPDKSKAKATPVRKSLKVDMPKEYVQALDITNVDATSGDQNEKPKPTTDKETKVTSSVPKEKVKKAPSPVRKTPEKKKEPSPLKKQPVAEIKAKLKLPSVLRSPSPPPKKTKEEEAAEKLEKEVKNLLSSDRTLLEEEGGLSLEELELEQLILKEKLQTAEAKLKDKQSKDGKTRKDQGVKKKGGKKNKSQEEKKNLEEEREALREARRLEKEKRLAEAEELQRKIREKEEDRQKQMAEEERTREEMEADMVRAQREAEEALLAEEEARSILATARKEAKEEREKRRKEDLERKRQEAQRRRLENKKIAEAARLRELEMKMSIADAEQRAALELEERLRKEEEERLEQERLEEEERLERLRMEEEEKKLAEMERLIDEEAMERLIREREEAEERRRAMALAARARAEEEELLRQEMEKERLRLEELRRQQEEAENARREEERRRLMELQRQEEEAREQMRLEMDRRKQAALMRREQNLERRNHSEGLKQNQELTRPWVFSYYVHWPRDTYEKLMGEDPKKKKGFGKSKPKSART